MKLSFRSIKLEDNKRNKPATGSYSYRLMERRRKNCIEGGGGISSP